MSTPLHPLTSDPDFQYKLDLCTVLLRLHPAICGKVLEMFEGLSARLMMGVGMFALKKGLVTFEIGGRRATQVVKAVLRPVLGESQDLKKVSS